MHIADLLLSLGLIWLAAKLAGEGMERLGQTAVLGELLVGVVIGPHALRLVNESQILHALAEMGVILLLFEIGLESDRRSWSASGLSPPWWHWWGSSAPSGSKGVLATALLTVVAVIGKLASGLAVYQKAVRAWPVAVGMVPRGEVGLIFAGIGLSTGVLDSSLYAAVVAMVMLSTFIAPPWLKALYRTPGGP